MYKMKRNFKGVNDEISKTYKFAKNKKLKYFLILIIYIN